VNNEEKILSILEQVNDRLGNLEQGQAKLEQDLQSVKQSQTVIQEDISQIKAEMKYAWQDIGFVEKKIKKHEREFHAVG